MKRKQNYLRACHATKIDLSGDKMHIEDTVPTAVVKGRTEMLGAMRGDGRKTIIFD